MNSVCITGRLAKDSEVRANGNGNSVINFTVVVNEVKKDGDQWKEIPSFIDCKRWCSNAGKLKDFMVKGKLVSVEGHLKQETWEKNGSKQSRIVCKAYKDKGLTKQDIDKRYDSLYTANGNIKGLFSVQ